MRVALYYPWIYLYGGPERTISELLRRSRHTWTVLTNRYEPEATFPVLQSATIRQMNRVPVKRSYLAVSKAAARIAFQKLPLEGHDALVVFCEGLGDLAVIRNYPLPVACLCFTPLRAAFDPYYQERYIDRKGRAAWQRAILKSGATLFRAADRLLWKRYSRVFAISREVRNRISQAGLYPESQIELLYPGVDIEQLRPDGTYSRNFLIPGRIMWTKNLELAIDAFLLLLARRPDLGGFSLTLAGYLDHKSQPYLEMLRHRARNCRQIRFVIAPSDEELFSVCRAAYCILYPPFNEDWGLVPLEAMALEKPVIAVNRGGPSESVIDGKTGFLTEPTPDRFARAMEILADNPGMALRMGAQARLRAAEFGWDRFCSRLDDSVEAMVRAHEKSADAVVAPQRLGF